MKNKRIRVGELYHNGWNLRDSKRKEFFATILNDLAEDICITKRLSRENLIELAGYLQKQNHELNNLLQSVAHEPFAAWVKGQDKIKQHFGKL